MNVQWQASFSNVNLYAIPDHNAGLSQQLTTNTNDKGFAWTVTCHFPFLDPGQQSICDFDSVNNVELLHIRSVIEQGHFVYGNAQLFVNDSDIIINGDKPNIYHVDFQSPITRDPNTRHQREAPRAQLFAIVYIIWKRKRRGKEISAKLTRVTSQRPSVEEDKRRERPEKSSKVPAFVSSELPAYNGRGWHEVPDFQEPQELPVERGTVDNRRVAAKKACPELEHLSQSRVVIVCHSQLNHKHDPDTLVHEQLGYPEREMITRSW
ncbi:hypothetical protein PRZ48_003791 [Zasmidium cellare]|uniref:Uncharacterized protein n=1 Tax=Zasmidium cellare TaxID=395010 RepID=A0ABR0EXE0_ZASCE|nr:hypothetical protein PRZ48_003791 [Zasmidium cellare]